LQADFRVKKGAKSSFFCEYATVSGKNPGFQGVQEGFCGLQGGLKIERFRVQGSGLKSENGYKGKPS
jgi:hypothetical protein